ncbi:MAG TPA: hypothetical protein VGM88_27245 [Kofleriaceae bacterium]|jgi:hypothetical protein
MTKIGLVLDPAFGPRILALARSCHVWVVASPDNSPVIREVWQELGPAVTSFKRAPGEPLQHQCAAVADLIEAHHGEHAQDPPWSEIEVFGVALDDELRDVFADLGATAFEATRDGFVARREGP